LTYVYDKGKVVPVLNQIPRHEDVLVQIDPRTR